MAVRRARRSQLTVSLPAGSGRLPPPEPGRLAEVHRLLVEGGSAQGLCVHQHVLEQTGMLSSDS